jgi:hypothetical protein
MNWTVHATADWDETLCGVETRLVELPDVVIDEMFDPSVRAPDATPCPKCYPPDEDRSALYAKWGRQP